MHCGRQPGGGRNFAAGAETYPAWCGRILSEGGTGVSGCEHHSSAGPASVTMTGRLEEACAVDAATTGEPAGNMLVNNAWPRRTGAVPANTPSMLHVTVSPAAGGSEMVPVTGRPAGTGPTGPDNATDAEIARGARRKIAAVSRSFKVRIKGR